ncbi:MAG: hypothetical protein UZ05_CHB002002061 [Chlorobi bacterium OLB5]|nr:MAG: hypothetical protein UZ05_CHB002002061 [Chlorobi bacterium OLB5]
MYFLLIFIILITALAIHIISEFKKKAELSGEADLSITAKNILPASRKCKECAVITLTILIITGILMLIEGPGTNWSFLNLSENSWKNIHLLFLVIFLASFGLHLYIHWSWLKNQIIRK